MNSIFVSSNVEIAYRAERPLAVRCGDRTVTMEVRCRPRRHVLKGWVIQGCAGHVLLSPDALQGDEVELDLSDTPVDVALRHLDGENVREEQLSGTRLMLKAAAQPVQQPPAPEPGEADLLRRREQLQAALHQQTHANADLAHEVVALSEQLEREKAYADKLSSAARDATVQLNELLRVNAERQEKACRLAGLDTDALLQRLAVTSEYVSMRKDAAQLLGCLENDGIRRHLEAAEQELACVDEAIRKAVRLREDADRAIARCLTVSGQVEIRKDEEEAHGKAAS